MQRSSIAIALALGIGGSAHVSLAQDKPEGPRATEPQQQTDAEKPGASKTDAQAAPSGQAADLKAEKNPVPPPTGRNLPEQGGKQEGSSKVTGTSPQPNVLEKGVLTAPGARTDVDTAPAKFSKRADRDDQLPIAAYRLRHLTGDQRREIAAQLGASGSGGPQDMQVQVGSEIPAPVALEALQPVPEQLTKKFPELRGAAFIRTSGKVVLVDRDNSLVIGVLEG